MGFALFALILLTALAVASSSKAAVESPPPPQVWSDKADYAPGETVTLSGANWASGEAVHIRVNDDAGETWRRDVDVTAAADGTISDQFNLPNWFVAQYTVTATGASSGTATWSFTDASLTVLRGPTGNPPNVTFTVTYQPFSNNICTTGGGTVRTAVVNSDAGTGLGGLGGGQGGFVKLTVPATPTTPSGYAFHDWSTGPSSDATIATTTSASVCVRNPTGSQNDVYRATYEPANSAPTCSNGAATTPEDTAKSMTLGCADLDGDALTYSIVSGPAHGSLSGTGANRTYTPDGNYNGSDSFTFKASDGSLDSNVATFSVTITAVNDAPTCSNGSATTPEDTAVAATLSCADVDGDALTYSIVSGPAHGSLSGTGASRTYTPNANYNGSDSFTFKANDGTVDSNVATFSLTISAVNDAPTCSNGAATTAEDTAKAMTLSCVDVDGDALTYSVVSGPAHGTLSGSGANRTYTPDANYNGSDSFTFKANDGTVDSNVATFSLMVTAVNDDPTVARDSGSVTVNEGQAAANSGTFADVDGDTVALSASVGTVVKHVDGTWSWSFDTSDGPDDSQTVTISATDGNGGSGSTTFSLTVNNVAPTVSFSASNDTSVDEGPDHHTYAFSVSDPGQDAFTVDSYGCGTYGTLVTGSLTTSTSGGSFKCVFPDGPNSSSVNVKVKDEDGASDTDSEAVQIVAIANVAPAVDVSGDANADEGSTHTYSYTVSDPGDDPNPTITESCGANGTRTDTPAPNSFDCTFPDGDASSTVSVTADDGDTSNNIGSDSVTVSVHNVAPTVTFSAGNDTTVNEGAAEHTYSYSISDPGDDTVSSVSTSCDPPHGTNVSGSDANTNTGGSFKCTFADGPDDADLTAAATDSDGATGATAHESVHVNNVAPTVVFSASNDTSVNEGTKHTYAFTVSDPGADTFTVDAKDCGAYGDFAAGSLTTGASGGSFQCSFADGPASTDVHVKVSDSDGASDTDSEAIQVVQVANVAPSVTAATDQSSDEGEGHSFSLGSFSDPGPDADWSVDVDWGDGSAHTSFTASAAGSLGSQSHAYADGPNDYTVTVTVTDHEDDPGDELSGSASFSVHVDNVAPSVTAAIEQSSNEGESHSFSLGSFTDPGDDGPWAVDVDWGDGSAHTAFSAAAPGPLLVKSHAYADGPADHNVTVTVTEAGSGTPPSGSATFSVHINNVAPTVSFSASNDTSVDEGATEHTYAFSVGDPGEDTFSVDASDCGSNGNLVAGSLATSASGGSFRCVFPDGPASTSVHVKVSDSDGASDTDSEAVQIVAIANVAPSVAAAADQSSNEGESHSFSLGSFSDPGPDADWSVDVDWGDGSADTSFSAPATGSLGSQSHTYADGPNDYTVTVTVTDHEADPADELSSSATFSVHVNNVAPTVSFSASNDTSVNEGSAQHTYSYTVSDPGQDTVTSVATSCDSPRGAKVAASDTNTNTGGSFTCTFDDGPADADVAAAATDSDSATGATAHQSVHVNNVAPSATFNAPAAVDEGSSFTLSLTSPTDPSSADYAAGFTYAFDCGSGYGAFSSTNTASCSTNDDGTRAVGGKVKDKDGGVREYTAGVQVNNVAPTATFSNNGPVSEGSSFTLTLSSPSDPSSVDTAAGFQYAFDCGSGTFGAYGSSSTAGCSTNDNGTRAVRGRIKDKDGGYTTYSAGVQVANVKPTITSVTASNTFAGPLAFMTSSISTIFTDPGSADTWVNLLTFSDGGSETSTTQPTAQGGDAYKFTLTHRFLTPGCKTVTSKVTDDDGGSDTLAGTPVNVGTGEFLPPVTNTPVTNKLKSGQVLPVKVKLTDCNGVGVTGLSPAIILKKGDLTSVADDSAVTIVPGSVSNADTNGVMRSNGDGSYIYNMSVSGLTLNTDYTIIIYPFGIGTPGHYLAHVIQATK